MFTLYVSGLQPAYVSDLGCNTLLRKLMALPMLPSDHMVAAFDRLNQQHGAMEPMVDTIMMYVRHAWLEHSVWSVNDLSVFKQTVRTNNDVEGWHRRLNSRASRGHLPLYLMIKLLFDESQYVAVQIRLLSEGKVARYARTKYAAINERLADLWERYERKDISTSRLLRSCSRLSLPFTETSPDS